MVYNVKISELAHMDIDGVVSYMADKLYNKTAAVRFLNELYCFRSNNRIVPSDKSGTMLASHEG